MTAAEDVQITNAMVENLLAPICRLRAPFYLQQQSQRTGRKRAAGHDGFYFGFEPVFIDKYSDFVLFFVRVCFFFS